MATAKLVKEITVIDPDTKGEVEISIFKHENGGMFGVDSSYIENTFCEYEKCLIHDPFNESIDFLNSVELKGV